MKQGTVFLFGVVGLGTLGICRLDGEEKSDGNPRITAVRNVVQTSRSGTNLVADVGDSVRTDESVKTGEQGLTELKGHGDTTVRVGGKSQVSYDPTNRQVKVDQGTVLIHAPLEEGPVKITAAGGAITVEEGEPKDKK